MVTRSRSLPKKEQFEGNTIGPQDIGKDEHVEYICPSCHQNLVKISDRQGNNEEWFCRNCSIPYLDSKEIRHRHRLEVPQKSEPAVATTPGQEYLNKSVEIHHEPKLKGAFKALRDRGIHITSYRED